MRVGGNLRVQAAGVYVQHESSSVSLGGMPGFAATAGRPDNVRRWNHIAEEIVRAATPQRAAKAQV
jgi:chemotaxis response regulator CheB